MHIPRMYSETAFYGCFYVHTLVNTGYFANFREVCTRKVLSKAVFAYIPRMYSTQKTPITVFLGISVKWKLLITNE